MQQDESSWIFVLGDTMSRVVCSIGYYVVLSGALVMKILS